MTEEKTAKQAADLAFLRKLWESLLPFVDVPSDAQFNLWLVQNAYDREQVAHGIVETASKNFRANHKFDGQPAYAVRFVSAVLNQHRRKLAARSIEEGGPKFAINTDMAERLGDVPVGTEITLAQFKRVLWRLADIREGRVQRPGPEAAEEAA
jgi:hypothetical protein